MDGLIIRSAEPPDVPRLVELLRAGALDGPDRSTDPGADLEGFRAGLADIRSVPGNDVLVAEVHGEVVGMCQIIVFRHFHHGGGRCAELESMHVLPRMRSQGVGGRLLEAAVATAERAGCYRIQLTSNRRRIEAHRFYQRHGFEPSHVGLKRLLGPAEGPVDRPG
jgi:GNAT superfamily N-acetyltransferase